MSYAQKSFSPFLESRKAHSSQFRARGASVLGKRRNPKSSRRLLELLAGTKQGAIPVSSLFERSGMDPVEFAETLERMTETRLILSKETDDDQIVELTRFGRRMAAGLPRKRRVSIYR